MSPQQRKDIARYLAAFDFSGLFSDPSLGWDWPETGKPLSIPFEGDFIQLDPVAEKRGVRVLHVPPQPDGTILPSDARKKLEKATTPLASSPTPQKPAKSGYGPHGSPVNLSAIANSPGKRAGPTNSFSRNFPPSPSPSTKKTPSTSPASSSDCAITSTATN